VYLAGVDFESAGQLGDGLVSLQGGQGYLGLEGRGYASYVIVSWSCSFISVILGAGLSLS